MGKEIEVAIREPVDCRVLGAVEIRCGQRYLDLGSARERCLLTALLLAGGRPISRDELWHWIWDDPPDTASSELDRMMTRLRKRLGTIGWSDALQSRDRRSCLDIPPDLVDAHRFTALTNAAREADDERASKLLRAALDLFTGEPMAGLSGPRIDGRRIGILEQRRRAELEFTEVEIRLGRAEDRIPDLARRFSECPDDSAVAGYTMTALHLAGRQREALATYERHRVSLNETGLDLPQWIKELQMRILNDDAGPRVVADALATRRADASDASEPNDGTDGRRDPGEEPAPTTTPPHVHMNQRADYMTNFNATVFAAGAHFGPRFGGRSDDD